MKNYANLYLTIWEILIIVSIAIILLLIVLLVLTYYEVSSVFAIVILILLGLFFILLLYMYLANGKSFKAFIKCCLIISGGAFVVALLYKDSINGVLFSSSNTLISASESNAFAVPALIGEILLVAFYLLVLYKSWCVFSDYLKDKDEHFKKFLFLSSFVISFFIFSYVMSNVLLSLNQYIELNISMITVDSIAAIFVSTALPNTSKDNTRILVINTSKKDTKTLGRLTYFVIILFLLTILITFRNVFTLPLGTRAFYIYNIVPTNTNMLVANAPNVGVVNITIPNETPRKMQILVNATNAPVTGQFRNAVVINPLPFACAFNGNSACNFKNSAGFDGMFLVSVFLNIYNFVLLGILLYFASRSKS